MNNHEMMRKCQDHMHRYVMVVTHDQQAYDGIVEGVDAENVYLAVPVGDAMMSTERTAAELTQEQGINEEGFSYGYPGYFPPYVYPQPYYPYPRPRRRRFQRLVLPLAALTALSLLPYY